MHLTLNLNNKTQETTSFLTGKWYPLVNIYWPAISLKKQQQTSNYDQGNARLGTRLPIHIDLNPRAASEGRACSWLFIDK